MPRIAVNRNKLRLKRVFGLRARLAVLALILVGPLMIDRIRVLDDNRDQQIALSFAEFTKLAEHSASAQRELMMSVEAVLRATAYVYATTQRSGQNCEIVRAAMRVDLPWIKSLSITDKTGEIRCSTSDDLIGLKLGDRGYFKKAIATQSFVVSDYLESRSDNQPIIMTAFPVSSIAAAGEAVIAVAVNLDWLSKLMSNLGNRPGLSTIMIDSTGRILAAPNGQDAKVGETMNVRFMQAVMSAKQHAPTRLIAADGSYHAISVTQVAGTTARLVSDINETVLAADADRDIRAAYVQLACVCLFVLFAALAAAERLIVRPIMVMTSIARRFGTGDWTARARREGLPAEFVPLARAFNKMATQLGQRERDMMQANDRLTVMASVDVLTGLANRRGFQSRLDFEWMKAQQTDDDLALLMIDVDHFKAFNDNYGHPEGDACLAQIGQTLGTIAHEAMGFAARYGGEEFCMLLPRADAELATRIGERIRSAIQELAIPHATTATQRVTASIGLASTMPNETQTQKDLVEAADAALYSAKHHGRNTVVCHGFADAVDTHLALAV